MSAPADAIVGEPSQSRIMPAPTYPIVGIPVQPDQPLPLRQEISTWVNNDDNRYQVSLFLRALAKLMAKPVEDKLGYFQVAGIHSYPLVPWDSESQPTPEPNPPGFCNHNLATFPTWHRPYMLLYEQVLYENMLELVSSWPISDQEKAIWLAAASKFRLPYWDWAQKQVYTGNYGIPQICAQDTWPIVKPGANGAKEPFANPLTGFINPKKDREGNSVPMGDESMGPNKIKIDIDDSTSPPTILPWDRCIGVSRYGMRSDQPESQWNKRVNNWEYANQAIMNPQWYDGQPEPYKSSSFADAVSRLFTTGYFDSWETFASTIHNKPTDTKNTDFMSLEYIHNVVHNATGGPYFTPAQISKDPVGFSGLGLGHMSDVPVAAFDPIFWLHHCNIDRLCAMWQTLNWNMWFDKPQGDDPAPSHPLLPFHHDKQNGSWTSDMGRDWRVSNYQYDDLKDMPPGEPTPEFQALLRQHIKELYPSTSSIVAPTGYTLANDTFYDYVINVVYDRYALNGRAYSILFYIGDPTKDFSASKSDPNFVGAIYTFSAPFVTADGKITCDNCGRQQAAKALSKAQIPLTLPLIRRAVPISAGYSTIPAIPLGPLEPEKVEMVLDHGLKWYFVALGGREVVDLSKFPNTEVAVLQGTGRHPLAGHIMPRYGDYTKLTDATKNKPLGYGHHIGPNHLIGDD